MEYFVYVIKRVADGRAVYVGQTTNPKQRWKQHRVDSLNPDRGSAIHFAMKKYGREAFEFEVLPVTFATEPEVGEAEIHLIQALRTHKTLGGYNILRGGSIGSRRGHKMSAESIAKMRLAQRGRKHTEETKAKIGAAHRGHIKTAETRARISAGRKGIRPSAEARAKISAAGLGRKHRPESIAKMVLAGQASAAKRMLPVVDQNGRVYPSCAHAARAIGSQQSTVRQNALGRLKHAGGYVFRYVERVP